MCGVGWYRTLSIPRYSESHFSSHVSLRPLAVALPENERVPFSKNTPHGIWLPIIIDIGAIAGLTSVALVSLLGQSRVFYAMAQDGLLPSVFAKVHPRTRTPWVSTIIIGKESHLPRSDATSSVTFCLGIVCAFFAAVFPLGILGEMTSIGTLVAFFLVHIAVIVVSSDDETVSSMADNG